MRCSLALIWTNELGKPEVLLELTEKGLTEELLKSYSLAIDRPKLWLRIKNVFKPIETSPIVNACLNEVIAKFKSKSAKAHFDAIPIRQLPTKVFTPKEGQIL